MPRIWIIIVMLLICRILVAQEADSLSTRSKEPLYYAADQSLFVMPTAYTMPKGTQSFTDFEVIVLQYAYAVGENTHLSAISLFPVNVDLIRSFTAGVKHNYLHKGKLQSAAWASYTIDFHTMTVGNVFSYGSSDASVHLAGSWGTNFTKNNDTFIFMAGVLKDASPKIALMLEAMTSSQVVEDQGDGLVTFGLRFKGKQTSWDIGGFRPIRNPGMDFIALPFLKATFIF